MFNLSFLRTTFFPAIPQNNAPVSIAIQSVKKIQPFDSFFLLLNCNELLTSGLEKYANIYMIFHKQ